MTFDAIERAEERRRDPKPLPPPTPEVSALITTMARGDDPEAAAWMEDLSLDTVGMTPGRFVAEHPEGRALLCRAAAESFVLCRGSGPLTSEEADAAADLLITGYRLNTAGSSAAREIAANLMKDLPEV